VHDHWGRQLTPEERVVAEMVVDFDAEETTCPACLTPFQPPTRRCPSCGLSFG
jgi:predicted amidophosphoribosyltransferase